jgi:hypothetical protein
MRGVRFGSFAVGTAVAGGGKIVALKKGAPAFFYRFGAFEVLFVQGFDERRVRVGDERIITHFFDGFMKTDASESTLFEFF